MSISRSSSVSNRGISNVDNTGVIETPPLQSAEDLAHEAEKAGKKCVEDEIKAYEDAGLVGEHDPLDLLRSGR